MVAGKLGAAALAQDVDTLVYVVPAGKFATVNINCANRSPETVPVSIWIGSGAAPNKELDAIEFETSVPGNVPLERTGFVCSAGESVWVRAGAAVISVRVHGFEEPV